MFGLKSFPCRIHSCKLVLKSVDNRNQSSYFMQRYTINNRHFCPHIYFENIAKNRIPSFGKTTKFNMSHSDCLAFTHVSFGPFILGLKIVPVLSYYYFYCILKYPFRGPPWTLFYPCKHHNHSSCTRSPM